jgi:hypothetical protein
MNDPKFATPVYLYALLQDQIVKYVGLTKNPQSRKQNHRKKKPKHNFVVLGEFSDVSEATEQERRLIQEYATVEYGWNKSPGGEYETNSGYSRKGIGGVPKGTVPWNKGISNCFEKSLIEKFKQDRKGVVFNSKLSPDKVQEIRLRFEQHEPIHGVGIVSKNGKPLTQERLFSKKYHDKYGITEANLYKIVRGKSWNMKCIKQIHSTKY